MPFLLDASPLITASNQYYPFSNVGGFWRWLRTTAAAGLVKVPIEVSEEIIRRDDELAKWLSDPKVANQLILGGPLQSVTLQRVLDQAYGSNPPVSKAGGISADPYLIARAIEIGGATVVTKETSKPQRKQGKKSKLPEACAAMGIACIDDFFLYFDQLNLQLP